MDKHSLIVKYLEIIAEQENMIQALDASNKTLKNRNTELTRKKDMYKTNAIEWKARADELRSCLQDTYNSIKQNEKHSGKKRYAIKMYKESANARVQ